MTDRQEQPANTTTRHGQVLPLSGPEAIRVLEQGTIGHLGCYLRDEMYVIPVSYAYENGCIYSHSREGKKIHMMRRNPNVCLQVEQVDGPFSWRSVIAWGTYEELAGDDAAFGMRVIVRALGDGDLRNSRLDEDFAGLLSGAIIYRIVIKRLSGRHEGRA